MTTEQLVCELARLLPDHSIAPVLNRLGIRSARGQTWTQLRVRNFRGAHQIPVYREGERAERHELILGEAANRLGVSKMTVVRLIRGQGAGPPFETPSLFASILGTATRIYCESTIANL
ncbi:hypothetical protein [Bradyrhizobium sp. ARR65]|uniref:hypothetical protein n=1 Tax=Bradyrhizobium sp. ARR65 TaxID=1040989 RepID=UPI0004671B2D|nr:hypothetical protein [Bradyrhizobium sp. ARR65]